MAFKDDDLASLADDFKSKPGQEIITPRVIDRRGGQSGFSHHKITHSHHAGSVRATKIISQLTPEVSGDQAKRLKDLSGDLGRASAYTPAIKAIKRKAASRAKQEMEYQKQRQIAVTLGLAGRSDGKNYSRHNRRLMWVQVVKIREIYAAGFISQKKLAKQFGVSQATIGQIVRRDIWRKP